VLAYLGAVAFFAERSLDVVHTQPAASAAVLAGRLLLAVVADLAPATILRTLNT
jgi:hypothetical protein